MLRGDSHRSYPPSTVSDGEGTVRLALGGAVGKTTKTRADETTIKAEDDEKKVESLYAVLFKDAEVSTEDGEDASDLFFKAINVTDSIYQTDSVRFKVSSGDYQICFVANPSAGLFDGLTAGSSSVANFKALVETKAPDTKPGMLMTSDFHKATVSTNDSININTVTLERAMARIDIVNKADGITIDSVKLVNRAMESVLINDGEKNALALTDTTYKALSLAGKADGTAAYKAKIYSYEQYGTEANAPSMEVYYRIGEKKYTHSIDFKDNDDNQINLKRNYLYTVNITNNAGKLTFTLTVTDWNQGETFVVSSDELIDGMNKIDYSGIKVGDIMLKDGSYVSVSSSSTLTETEKANAIGVVAYLYTGNETRISDEVKSVLSEPHGLVLALKNASSSYVDWGPSNDLVGTAYTSHSSGYADISGYSETQTILAKESLSSYPAFNCISTFNDGCPAPAKTTGWYIPSYGELVDVLDALGNGSLANSVKNNSSVNTVTSSANMKTAINEALAKAGEGNYGEIGTIMLWTSSEQSKNSVLNAFFNNESKIQLGYSSSKSGGYVRCVLAF